MQERPRRALGNAQWTALLLVASCAACRSGASSGSTASMPAPALGDGAVGPNGGMTALSLSTGGGGIGFDDLTFASSIHKVLAPAGATGSLDLIDPSTLQVTVIGGFSGSPGAYGGGHGQGTTSADEGRGLLFAIDRTAEVLDVIDPAAKAIVASVKLGASPDYVRWVETTGEVWVTEPDSDRIEVFSLPPGPKPTPVHVMNIPVKGGPESLLIDTTRKRAFTHLWRGSSVAIDLASHSAAATWPNGCSGSRGIAIDAKRGFLFAGCAEGALSVLDVDHDGKPLGSVSSGSGVDVIAYSPALAHVYLPGASSATMAFIGIAPGGHPTLLGTVPTAAGAHCVAADDRGNAWVCDPDRGKLLVFKDPYPAIDPSPTVAAPEPAPSPSASGSATAHTWSFEGDSPGGPPSGFSFGRTGQGREGKWLVRAGADAPSGGNVLAQTDADTTDYRFPLAWANEPTLADLELTVRCKPVSGDVDEACGLVFRLRDANNYYLTRANAAENNVRLYFVKNGRRQQMASYSGKVTRGAWHSYRVRLDGDHFEVFWDGAKVLDHHDKTFLDAGKVGVWTKADSVTEFDDLSVKPL
jgi:DNA-binding beta-propeller fold protein YncE